MEAGKRSAWMVHVKKTIKQHRGMQLKDVLKLAKKTYKGGQLQGKMGPMGGRRHRSRRGGQPNDDMASLENAPLPPTLERQNAQYEEDTGVPPSAIGGRKHRRSRKHRGGQLYSFAGGPYTDSVLADGGTV